MTATTTTTTTTTTTITTTITGCPYENVSGLAKELFISGNDIWYFGNKNNDGFKSMMEYININKKLPLKGTLCEWIRGQKHNYKTNQNRMNAKKNMETTQYEDRKNTWTNFLKFSKENLGVRCNKLVQY